MWLTEVKQKESRRRLNRGNPREKSWLTCLVDGQKDRKADNPETDVRGPGFTVVAVVQPTLCRFDPSDQNALSPTRQKNTSLLPVDPTGRSPGAPCHLCQTDCGAATQAYTRLNRLVP
ncbi:hypothetical protein GBF38_003429 [Nibea albiflora]|uniref:Uncharacterized protein n=1 Tax=Nibea albiflora TaxID=240163 RepID=A0ACB7FL82_NIBAL|nr:hypothetical protein GBF38_003429 [Nibea albiflora]